MSSKTKLKGKSKKPSKKQQNKHKEKNPKKTFKKNIIVLTIVLFLFVLVLISYDMITRNTVSLVNFFTEKCDWFGTLQCKELTIYSNGTLKLRLLNPSLNLSSANLFLFDSNGQSFSCDPIGRWLQGSEKVIFCTIPSGAVGKRINFSFEFRYSPEGNPIYITETGHFITRYE